MDREYPPLPASCVRNLVDKFFEKRKLASVEIERLTKDLFAQNKLTDIGKLVGYFSHDFIMSSNPHARKGGLLGLASVAIGLHHNAGKFYKSIVPPVLRLFQDDDSRVRYYACETLYNVMKITRKETLYLLSEVFDAVSRGVSDSDLNVRQGAVQCDRLLKEIVTEPDFVNLSVVVSLLRERVYTNNPFARQFIVSWTNTLYSVPGMKITTYLPQLLDGLFRILSDPNPDIRRQCEILLTDLLNEIRANPDDICFSAMINILLVHCRLCASETDQNQHGTGADDSEGVSVTLDPSNQTACLSPMHILWSGTPTSSGEQLKQRTALIWIRAFVELDPGHLLPFASGIIGAVLPCFLEYNSPADTARDSRATLETAVRINETLLLAVRAMKANESVRRAISSTTTPVWDDDVLSDSVSSDPLNLANFPAEQRRKKGSAQSAPAAPRSVDRNSTIRAPVVSTDSILPAICHLLRHQSLLTRLAALRWIEVLGEVNTRDVLPHVVRLLPLMLTLLADPEPEMVHSVVRLLGNLCNHPEALLGESGLLESLNIPTELSQPLKDDTTFQQCGGGNPFCLRFLLDLVLYLSNNGELLMQRGDMIITDLCEVIGAEVVYCLMSTIISHTQGLQSASVLIRALNRILLTQPSLHDLRNQLRSVNTKYGCRLLERLFRAWCQNPVALLSLYMLTQNYRQSNRLVKSFGEIHMTMDVLVEIDQLIQMIESPIFSTLRMHLLDKRHSADLRETLYCLLMCIPQTDAFHTLWRRLQCVPTVDNLSNWPVSSVYAQPDVNLMESHIPFEELFDHFHTIHKLRGESSNQSHTKALGSEQNTKSSFEPKQEAEWLAGQNSSLAKDASPVVGSAEVYLSQSLAKLGIHVPEMTSISN